jgi:aminoglycoside/choline kinase family phosphotransferase
LGAGIGIPYSVDHVASRLPEIERWLAELAGGGASFDFETIAGGASPRKFHRVRPISETAGTKALLGGEASAIVMEVPPDTPDVAFARNLGRPWPFLEVRALLEEKGVRVPRLLADARERDLLLVEDLGPTLAEHLAVHPDERESSYADAVRDLARAQAALDPLPEDSIVRLRAFDEALLGWEVDHFREFGLEARGKMLRAAERATFDAAKAVLVGTLAGYPRGFVHRDYQSRNLLVTASAGVRRRESLGGRLGWVDFQDALLGPRAYDLVALLCDSYQPFDRGFVERRLDEYAAARGFGDDERRALGREFDLITVQRKLKDAGRFVFIEKMRSDASFLPFVEPTLAIVRQALTRLPDVPELRELARLLDALDV